jgi:ABC-2 type transport system permease protein
MHLARVFGVGWLLHFKQETRNPFFLWIVIDTPLIYATMTYFLFRRSDDPSTLVAAAVGTGLMGAWSLVTTAAAASLHRQRRVGVLELLVASPTPFWAVALPITTAIAAIGMYSVAVGLLYVRLLFGVPVSIEDPVAFVVALVPATISIGMLGFLLAAAFVRYRAAWAVGNLFEFPVWTVCGFLIPLAFLPGWVEPLSWILSPTWAVSALGDAALGKSAWGDTAMCLALSAVYAVLGALAMRTFLHSARVNATLSLT